jgi:hypothetical protein
MITDQHALVTPNARNELLLRRGATAYASLRQHVIDLVTPEARAALLSACPAARLSS